MSTSNEQIMICNKNDGAPEQQDDKRPTTSSSNNDVNAVAEGIDEVQNIGTIKDDNDYQCNGGGEEIISNTNKECTSCEQNNYNVDNITDGINNVVVLDDKSTCAACGKEGNSSDMNTCNKCKSVKYCNAACKKKHRSKHKKACEKRVAELYDEQLFKQVEQEECPICMLPLPFDSSQVSFQTCCGKRLCHGCIYAMEMSKRNDLCAFCRTPLGASDEEQIKRVKRLMDKGNGGAFHLLAGLYARGMLGLPRDHRKAIELLLKAGELGFAKGYYGLGNSYYNGDGVVRDVEKAKYYFELAAMNGHIKARHNLAYRRADRQS